MKIIKKYLALEFYPSILFGLFFYTSIFLISAFFEIAELSIKNGIPILKASYIVFLSFPYIITTTIPISLFYGIMLSISKLQSQNEIFAFYALGVSKKVFFKEIIKISLIFFIFHLFISIYLLPKANKKIVQYRLQLLQSGISKAVEPRTFIKAFPQKVVYIKNIKGKNSWKDIFIVDYSQGFFEQFLYAKMGELYLNQEGDQLWIKLYDSINVSLKGEKSLQKNIAKEQNILLFPPVTQNVIYKTGVREKTLKELKMLFNDESSIMRNKAKAEFHKRFVLPSLTLIFPFLALAISLRKKEKGATKGYAFLISLAIIFLSYVLLIYFESFAIDGKLNPHISMWIVPFVFIFLTILFLILPKTEKKFIFFKKEEKTLRKKERKNFISLNIYLLDYYILKNFLPYFIFSILAISFLFIIIDFSQTIDDIQRSKPKFLSIFYYYLYSLPQGLYDFIIPISLLASIAVCISLMERNKELSALKSLGISLYRSSAPLILFSLLSGILLFFFSETFLPLSNTKFEEYKNLIFGGQNIPKFARFLGKDTYLAGNSGWIYRYKAIERRDNSIIDFMAFNFENYPYKIISTENLIFYEGKALLKKGIERVIFEDKIDFKEIDNELYNLEEKADFFFSITDSPNNLNLIKLKNYIENLKRAGYKPSNYEIRFWQKIFYPIFLFLLALLAVISSFYFKGIYQIWGNLTRTILVGIIFWLFIIIFAKIGEMNIIPSFFSVFSPYFLFLLIELYFYLGIER